MYSYVLLRFLPIEGQKDDMPKIYEDHVLLDDMTWLAARYFDPEVHSVKLHSLAYAEMEAKGWQRVTGEQRVQVQHVDLLYRSAADRKNRAR